MKAAFILFDRMTSLDFIGFYDPVTRLKSMQILDAFDWRICARSQLVTDDRGLKIEAGSVDESLDFCDLLFIPGGFGTRALQHDQAFLKWIRTADRAKLKVSVCTGALILGAAGYLAGRRATTHPGAYTELGPYCAQVVAERVVDEGEVITAGGVSSAIDLGLHVVQRLAGPEARAKVAAQMHYPYQWEHAK
ncbi:MAG: DJ-1/PfpI family protein [Betaproteobacteria bacterium]